MSSVTQQESDNLYKAEKYIDIDVIEWERINSRTERYKLSIPIVTEDGESLILDAFYSPNSKRGKNYSFCLRYKTTVIIRKWDNSYCHYKDYISHKHYWDGYDSANTYEVNDICEDDVNKALFDFFEECNIKHNNVSYQKIL